MAAAAGGVATPAMHTHNTLLPPCPQAVCSLHSCASLPPCVFQPTNCLSERVALFTLSCRLSLDSGASLGSFIASDDELEDFLSDGEEGGQEGDWRAALREATGGWVVGWAGRAVSLVGSLRHRQRCSCTSFGPSMSACMSVPVVRGALIDGQVPALLPTATTPPRLANAAYGLTGALTIAPWLLPMQLRPLQVCRHRPHGRPRHGGGVGCSCTSCMGRVSALPQRPPSSAAMLPARHCCPTVRADLHNSSQAIPSFLAGTDHPLLGTFFGRCPAGTAKLQRRSGGRCASHEPRTSGERSPCCVCVPVCSCLFVQLCHCVCLPDGWLLHRMRQGERRMQLLCCTAAAAWAALAVGWAADIVCWEVKEGRGSRDASLLL